MKTNTLRPENVAQSTAIRHHYANMHNIRFKLENRDDQSIFIYHKTIGAIFRLSESYGWHRYFHFSLITITHYIVNNITTKIK